MSLNFLSSCLIVILLTCFVIEIACHEAINNGDRAGVHQFRYQISIQVYNQGHKCGAGILNDLFVISAAHCVVNWDNSLDSTPIYAAGGTNNLHGNGVAVDIVKIFVPAVFKRATIGGAADIAVLMLKHPLGLAHNHNLAALTLPKDNRVKFAHKIAVIAGFGIDHARMVNNEPHYTKIDSFLKYAEVDVLNYCPRGQVKIKAPNDMLCARVRQLGPHKPLGVCRGDSGGPLVYDNTVIGILSVGPRSCRDKETAGIYTRVSSYLKFIHTAMANKHHSSIRTLDLHH